MHRRDQELLEKQLRGLCPPRNDGVIVLLLAAMFFAGMTLGGVLFAQKSDAIQVASTDLGAAISLQNGAPPALQR
jgi:hypothetical protein